MDSADDEDPTRSADRVHADMAVPNKLADDRNIGVSDDEVALDVDDVRASARQDLPPRDPRLNVLPNSEPGSRRKQNRQPAITREKKDDASGQSAGGERQASRQRLAPGKGERVGDQKVQSDQD